MRRKPFVRVRRQSFGSVTLTDQVASGRWRSARVRQIGAEQLLPAMTLYDTVWTFPEGDLEVERLSVEC